MLFSQLLPTLLSGVIAYLAIPFLRIRGHRDNGYRLVLLSLSVGILFTIAGFLVEPLLRFFYVGMKNIPYLFDTVAYTWRAISSAFSLSGTPHKGPVIGLLLSLAVAAFYGLSKEIRKKCKLHSIRHLIKETNDPTEVLFDFAINERKIVALTLRNRKVYIGYIFSTLDPMTDELNVKVEPIQSGYRSTDTLELNITTDYSYFMDAIRNFFLAHPDIESDKNIKVNIGEETEGVIISGREFNELVEDFGVVFPWSEIESVTLWNNQLNKYFEKTAQINKLPNMDIASSQFPSQNIAFSYSGISDNQSPPK